MCLPDDLARRQSMDESISLRERVARVALGRQVLGGWRQEARFSLLGRLQSGLMEAARSGLAWLAVLR